MTQFYTLWLILENALKYIDTSFHYADSNYSEVTDKNLATITK